MTDRTITLTTDFGLADPYVAAMKGVILNLNPRATIVDITHDVRPQRLVQAVYLTRGAWPYFAPDTIHVVVVDPGVGTQRRSLVIETPRGSFIGPDNGVLSAALPDEARPTGETRSVRSPTDCHAFAIASKRYMRPDVSATFHGRDVFAPVAAHLSLGVAPRELGDPVEEIIALPALRAARDKRGTLRGHVIHIDRFGNAITDIRSEDLPKGAFAIELAGRSVRGPVRTYAAAEGLAAIAGSNGFVEIALPNGSAAAELRIDIGERAILRPD